MDGMSRIQVYSLNANADNDDTLWWPIEMDRTCFNIVFFFNIIHSNKYQRRLLNTCVIMDIYGILFYSKPDTHWADFHLPINPI